MGKQTTPIPTSKISHTLGRAQKPSLHVPRPRVPLLYVVFACPIPRVESVNGYRISHILIISELYREIRR